MVFLAKRFLLKLSDIDGWNVYFKSFSSICLIDIFLISRKNVIFNELIVNNMNLENIFQLNFSYSMEQAPFTNE
jgi:hypothetical protein